MSNKPIIVSNSQSPYWPNWFLLDNYRCLEELTVTDFINELDYRLLLYRQPTRENGQKLCDSQSLEAITAGNPILNDFSTSERNARQCESVIALNDIDILTICQDYQCSPSPTSPSYLLPHHSQKKQMLLSIDLSNATDESILNSAASIIAQQRVLQNIPEPCSKINNQASIGAFKKLLSYKAIPYLDLLLHARAHKSQGTQEWRPIHYPQGSLTELLFGYKKTSEQFKNSVKPFYQKTLFCQHTFSKLKSNLLADRELSQRKLKHL